MKHWHGDDWLRINHAEDKLINYFLANRGTRNSELAWNKAQDLRDAYDNYWTSGKISSGPSEPLVRS